MLIARRKEQKPWLNSCTAVTALICLLCAADWGYYVTRQTPDVSSLPPTDIAYVVRATELRSSADSKGSGIMTLTPSTPLHLLATRGSSRYVETLTGIRGWVNQADATPLAADATSPELPLLLRFK